MVQWFAALRPIVRRRLTEFILSEVEVSVCDQSCALRVHAFATETCLSLSLFYIRLSFSEFHPRYHSRLQQASASR